MRLWTVHPHYLDQQGLVALWREALLAQAVLLGRTTGYTRHPQLVRFRSQPSPVAGIATYLTAVHAESMQRGYSFDANRIQRNRMHKRIPETQGQLDYEWGHLLRKLQERTPEQFELLHHITKPDAHPPESVMNFKKDPKKNLTTC